MKEKTKEAICEVLVERILKNQVPIEHSHVIIDALKEAGNIEVASKLIPMLKSCHESSCIIAAEIIGHFGDETMIEHLLAVIRSSSRTNGKSQFAVALAIKNILKKCGSENILKKCGSENILKKFLAQLKKVSNVLLNKAKVEMMKIGDKVVTKERSKNDLD